MQSQSRYQSVLALMLIALLIGCGSEENKQTPIQAAKKQDTAVQQRGLHQAAVTYANEHKDSMPPSLGHMVVNRLCTADYVLAPWSDDEAPADFDSWSQDKQIAWCNEHAGFVYLGAGRKADFNSNFIILFELPQSLDDAKLVICYDDGRATPLNFAEADKLIKAQTGHSVAEWMDAKSPGAGQM